MIRNTMSDACNEHILKYANATGRDKYGRPPAPGINYMFDYTNDKWIPYKNECRLFPVQAPVDFTLGDTMIDACNEHIRKYANATGRDKYGRPPAPGINYVFDYTTASWIPYK